MKPPRPVRAIRGLALSDPRWNELQGGYGTVYDPRPTLALLERGEANDETWNALCQELFHQGDVGEASYATVPHLVRIHLLRGVPDWNTYSLASIIEDARQTARSPKLPDFLREGYEAAWRTLIEIGLVELADAREPLLVSNIIAAISMGKRQFQLGKFAMLFDEDERQVLLDDAGW